VGFLNWLQELGRDANPAADGFQASMLYLIVSVALPVTIGMFVGFGLRFLERVFGVELGRGGH
jgi:hypothetical protein